MQHCSLPKHGKRYGKTPHMEVEGTVEGYWMAGRDRNPPTAGPTMRPKREEKDINTVD
jgi:hypothetical protein